MTFLYIFHDHFFLYLTLRLIVYVMFTYYIMYVLTILTFLSYLYILFWLILSETRKYLFDIDIIRYLSKTIVVLLLIDIISLTVIHKSFIYIHMCSNRKRNKHFNILGLSSKILNVCICIMDKYGFCLGITLMST